jgi:predicted phosphodiesterase
MRSGSMASKSNLCVVLPDIHIPGEDRAALTWALAYTVRLKPNHVILLGDVMDFRSLSRFPKSPAQTAALRQELKRGREWIALFEEVIRPARVTFLLGNHEERVSKYLWKQAPELNCLPELAVPALLRVPERWKVVPYRGYVMEQGVMVTHGERYGRTATLSNLAEYGCSVITGHSHRAVLVDRRMPNGKILTGVEAGCLCKLNQGYSTTTNWVHALAVIQNGAVRLVRRHEEK